MSKLISLNNAEWTLRSVGDLTKIPTNLRDRDISAVVPGCVHTDLIAAGHIPDPYFDRNERGLEWIGWTDWSYTCHFDHDDTLQDGERFDLVCEGLDTLATLEVNGRVIGEADNMHRRWRFDLRDALVTGRNVLCITFASPMKHITAKQPEYAALPAVGSGSNPQLPHHMIRKMACNFGWDWGPALVTSGIWRPIALHRWSEARIADVRISVLEAAPELAKAEMKVDLEYAGQAAPHGVRLTATLTSPDGRIINSTNDLQDHDISFVVERPQLWWPSGYGDQPLYELAVELRNTDNRLIDIDRRRIGLKTVELIATADTRPFEELGQGETFYLRINGQRVYCKGANWIPDDCFPHRVNAARYRDRVQKAVLANMNMLRIWGGGIYEDHAFYDVCDELGIMVWQDFCCACACYPETPSFYASFEAEARDNIARLSSHVSLTLWNGCNENIWGTFCWGDDWVALREQDEIGWGAGYYFDLFPRLVNELDPGKPYWAGSPYSGDADRDPNANEYGNRHIWDVWNGAGDYRNYLSHYPRFGSEFGFHGPPTWPTLDASIPRHQRDWLSDAMVHHNKQTGGQQLALDRIKDSFIVPDDFEDQWFLASLNQARALTLGCEWFRALAPWNSGSLYWQFNDCWPASSWSAIDDPGRPKLLYYATKQFFRPRLVTVMPTTPVTIGDDPEALAVYLHNDHPEAWKSSVVVRHMNFDGLVFRKQTCDFDVAARGRQKIDLDSFAMGDPGELIVADVGIGPDTERGIWFFGRDYDTPYPVPELDLDVQATIDGQDLHISARTLVRDLCVFPEMIRPSAAANRQLITLLPGESTHIHLCGLSDAEARQLTGPPVLQCVNLFGQPVPPTAVETNASVLTEISR